MTSPEQRVSALEARKLDSGDPIAVAVLQPLTDDELEMWIELYEVQAQDWGDFLAHPENWTDAQRAPMLRWEGLYSLVILGYNSQASNDSKRIAVPSGYAPG